MSAEFRDETTGRELAGLVIVVVGFGLLLNAIGILPFPWIFARFWFPAMFVVVGIILLSKSRDSGLAGFFFIGFGLLFFLGRLNSMTFNIWHLLGPAIVIWIGLSVLMKGSAFRNLRRTERADNPHSIHAAALLGAIEQRSTSQQFTGGELTAFMGGAKLDLRDAEIEGEEAVLDVFTVMGGIEIIIPERWTVQNSASAVLGSVEDTSRPARDATKRLTLRGTSLLGSIEVRN